MRADHQLDLQLNTDTEPAADQIDHMAEGLESVTYQGRTADVDRDVSAAFPEYRLVGSRPDLVELLRRLAADEECTENLKDEISCIRHRSQ